MNEIEEIFASLRNDCLDLRTDDNTLLDYAKKIHSAYEVNYHHFRTKIALCFSNDDALDGFDMFATYIEQVLDYAQRNEETKEYVIAVEAFLDGILLELHRSYQFTKFQTQISINVDQQCNQNGDWWYQKISKEMGDLNTRSSLRLNREVEEFTSQMQATLENQRQSVESSMQHRESTLQSRLDSLDTHSVTVLGIFTAVTFAFSGGFTLIGSAFSELSTVTYTTSFLLVALLSLLGMVLYNCICVTIWGISKFLGKPISEDFAIKSYSRLNSVLTICMYSDICSIPLAVFHSNS